MKGFEWLLDEPDLNRLACISDHFKISLLNHTLLPLSNETLIEYIARTAANLRNLELIKFIIGRGYDVNTPLGCNRVTLLYRTNSYKCQRFLIDHGANVTHGYLYEKTVKFIASRNAARLGAFAVLRALRTINRNVASVIARVVWALRAQTI